MVDWLHIIVVCETTITLLLILFGGYIRRP